MLQVIKPFRASYYNLSFRKKLDLLVCPPYDVINKRQLKILRKNSPYNFSYIVVATNKNYKAIGERFARWFKKNILVEDAEEALYFHEQNFFYEGKSYSRFGILAILRLDEKSIILPHEYTFEKPKEDRRRILEEVKANLSPIFVITTNSFLVDYKSFFRKKPFLEFKDFNGSLNRIWKITNDKIIETICNKLRSQKLIIADGHHRFEVARDYYNDHKGEFKDLNYILSYITFPHKGLLVLPTHRIVEIEDKKNIFKKLEKYFYIRKVNQKNIEKKLKSKGSFCFGVYTDNAFYFLRLKDKKILDKIFNNSIYKEIDTYVLHNFVFSLFKVKKGILYTHSTKEVKMLASKNKIAFLVRPTPLEVISKVAKKGLCFPQKSTYFYPKVSCGAILRRFRT